MELFYGQRDSLGQMNWKVAQQRFKAHEVEVEVVEEKKEDKNAVTYRNSGSVIVNTTSNGMDRSAFARTREEALRMLGYPAKYTYRLNGDTAKTAKLSEKETEALKKLTKTQTAMYQAISLNQLGWINVDRFINIPDKTQLFITLNDSKTVRSVCVFLVFKTINSVLQRFYCPAFDIDLSFRDIPVGYNVRLIAYGFDDQGELYTHSSDLTLKNDENLSINLQKTANNDLDKLFAYK